MMDTTLYTVTVVANNNSMGSVFGSGSFRWGATDTLIAVPDSGYQLKYWVSNLGDTLTTSTIVITVKQNVVWTAHFDYELKIQYRFYGLGCGDSSWHDAYDTFDELKQNATVNSTVYGSYKLWENYPSRSSDLVDLHIPVTLDGDLKINTEIDTRGKNVEVYYWDGSSWKVLENGFNNTLWFINKGNNIYQYQPGSATSGIGTIAIKFIE